MGPFAKGNLLFLKALTRFGFDVLKVSQIFNIVSETKQRGRLMGCVYTQLRYIHVDTSSIYMMEFIYIIYVGLSVARF
jgi:hypothetical protein